MNKKAHPKSFPKGRVIGQKEASKVVLERNDLQMYLQVLSRGFR